MSGRVLGIIPARLASTRLPNKPLFPLLGHPLVEWVWKRVEGMSVLDQAVVATDSEEVADLCRAIGAPVELTSSDHPSGTDRCAEVARKDQYRSYDIVVNIQGDEPLMKEGHLVAAIELVRDGGWEIGTCATPVLEMAAWENPSVVKVARACSGRALYFSRAPIPHKRDRGPTLEELRSGPFLRHIGLYSYTREALEKWVALVPSPLEELERLEQLRPLEAGLSFGVAVVEAAEFGVDTPEDAAKMEKRLEELMNYPHVKNGQ